MADTDTVAVPVFDLEESTLEVVPCGGVSWPVPHPCPGQRSAVVRLAGGCCFNKNVRTPQDYKCIPCYSEWLRTVVGVIAQYGAVICPECMTRHTTPEGLGWYAPF